jgi:hypothetical protein
VVYIVTTRLSRVEKWNKTDIKTAVPGTISLVTISNKSFVKDNAPEMGISSDTTSLEGC